MKLTALPILALSLAGFTTANDADTCQKKNGNLMKTIANFCSNQALLAPSNYAKNGATSSDKHSHIYIDGSACKPAQWIPQSYCLSQFHHVCAQGGAHGGNRWEYGNGGCQIWYIKYDRHPI